MLLLSFFRLIKEFLCLVILYSICINCMAQQSDSSAKKKNGFFNEVIGMISRDTSQAPVDQVKRLDQEYLPFSGFIIRDINIVRVPFGSSFRDTTRKSGGTFVKLANALHHRTKENVIANNLFFKEKDTINPYLLADNKKYLRGLSYLRDAEIEIHQIQQTDSADVTVYVKDIFSLGGSINSFEPRKTNVEMGEDNIAGSGTAAILYGLYDKDRKKNFALGGELIRRNVGGSFINQTIGYRNYYSSLRMPRQENYYYYNLEKPLLNRFMNFTYEFNASYHNTSNRYSTDSIYLNNYRYNYYQFEGWLGYNINAKSYAYANDPNRLRLLSGMRVITRTFRSIPEIYKRQYNWQFTDLTAFLGSFTLYRQNYLKAQYIFGFGKFEDIPEGLIFSATAGHTTQANISRPYINLSFEKYGFLENKSYIHYTLKSEGYISKSKPEDINLLGAINYFSPLKKMGKKWLHRYFLNFTATRQINPVLNEPLFINSSLYGMPEYGNGLQGGNLRITAEGESIFFSPWWVAAFRFAPLVFGNATIFRPSLDKAKLYSFIGTGLRIRNESLVFGTIEIKGFYLPQKNAHHKSFGGELSLNISFEQSNQFITKPDFIQVN